MKKIKLKGLLCFLCSLSLIVAMVFAATERVYDLGNLLSPDQESALQASIDTITSSYNMDVAIVTTDDLKGETPQTYADKFFLAYDMGLGSDESGTLLLIELDTHSVYISTHGQAIVYLTDARIQLIIDEMYQDLKAGNYYGACTSFLKQINAVYKAGIPKSRSEGTTLPKLPLTASDVMARVGISALIALAISISTFLGIKYRYKHPKFTVPPVLPDLSSVHYTAKRDEFIHTHTTRVPIPKPPANGGGSSGGGSSTHSTGGSTFGGGGRSF